ncbi:EamA family transporter [Halomonas aquatica]|uniref:EamA family transporter n=1 Tax=Halomonas aquatica TaxID=3151123 RepID=A0ABV1NHD6_9GAMM
MTLSIPRAVYFAAGAAMIGLVVVPTEEAFATGLSTAELVTGRLFWGALAVIGVCRLNRGAVPIQRTPREHLSLLRNGLLIGWATIFLYSLALKTNDVTPVIVTLVGTSAVVGFLVETSGRLRLEHVFILTSVLVALIATILSAHNARAEVSWTLSAAVLSGVIYGLLPVLLRGRESDEDLTSVGWYLTYGCVIAAALALLTTDTTIAGLLEAAGNGDVILAGAVGTGLGYALLQLGVAHGDDGREPLSPGVAGILYGFEPITAIVAAALWLRQPISPETMFFSCAFLMLAFSAGSVLKARVD